MSAQRTFLRPINIAAVLLFVLRETLPLLIYVVNKCVCVCVVIDYVQEILNNKYHSRSSQLKGLIIALHFHGTYSNYIIN